MALPITLSNGVSMDRIGIGSWQAKPGEVGNAIKVAIEAGYRHLDLAKVYQNQVEVGKGIAEGIKSAGIKREDLFIVSKLWNSQHKPQDVASALDDCLQELGLTHLDLYLIHFPVAFKSSNPNKELFPKNAKGEVEIDDSVTIVDTWKAMTELPKEKARLVGVSNFTAAHIDAITSKTGVKPSCLQVERHPLLPQHDLMEYCAKQKIPVVAYSPLGNNTAGKPLLINHEKVKAIANKHKIEPAQVLIAWGAHLEHVAVIPKSVTPSRIASNLELKTLDDVDIHALDALGASDEAIRYNVPAWAESYNPRWSIKIWNDPKEAEAEHVVQVGA